VLVVCVGVLLLFFVVLVAAVVSAGVAVGVSLGDPSPLPAFPAASVVLASPPVPHPATTVNAVAASARPIICVLMP
jgi:hypothetical protein